MTLKGKWFVVEMAGYDMAGPGSYILFDKDGGECALDLPHRFLPRSLRKRFHRVRIVRKR